MHVAAEWAHKTVKKTDLKPMKEQQAGRQAVERDAIDCIAVPHLQMLNDIAYISCLRGSQKGGR